MSHALLISQKKSLPLFFLSRALLSIWYTWTNWFMVESPGINPDWNVDKSPLSLIKLNVYFKKQLAPWLCWHSWEEIWACSCWKFFFSFFLYSGNTLANFQESGNCLHTSDILINRVSGFAILVAASRNILGLIPSGPVALFTSRVLRKSNSLSHLLIFEKGRLRYWEPT